MRNLDQIRAERALQAARTLQDGAIELAKKLPQMLRSNGLLATWLFLCDKGAPGAQVLVHLLSHLKAQVGNCVPDGDPEVVLSSWVGEQSGLSGRDLQRLTAEAIEFAGWLKRTAEIRGSA